MAFEYTLPATVAGVVAILCAILAIATWRAMLRTGNGGITFVSLAFGVLAVKGAAKTANLAWRGAENAGLELVFSLLDLIAASLFAWPLLRNRRS